MTKELLKEVSVSDLRDQLEAKEQMIKELKTVLKECKKLISEHILKEWSDETIKRVDEVLK